MQQLAAEDRDERPRLLARYPRLGEYRADGLVQYYDLEPESCFVATACGAVIGNLLGAVDARVTQTRAETLTRRLRWRKVLQGAYGFPGFLPSVVRTERARPLSEPPRIDAERYPGELHIGVAPSWQRRGVGRLLVAEFESYLVRRRVPGYRVSASSYRPAGVQFFRRVGFHEWGTFVWRLHDGSGWRVVTECVFVRDLSSRKVPEGGASGQSELTG